MTVLWNLGNDLWELEAVNQTRLDFYDKERYREKHVDMCEKI